MNDYEDLIGKSIPMNCHIRVSLFRLVETIELLDFNFPQQPPCRISASGNMFTSPLIVNNEMTTSPMYLPHAPSEFIGTILSPQLLSGLNTTTMLPK